MRSGLINYVPNVRGKLTPNANISEFSWFKVGGNAELLFEPADKVDLINFLKDLDENINIFVIGGASNLLIRDGGIPGVTIKLNKIFNKTFLYEENINVGASVKNMAFSNYARKIELPGYEFLSGIPGTIGGAVRMNSGAYGKSISDILEKIEVVDGINGCYQIKKKDLKMKYREVFFPIRTVIVNATFKIFKNSKRDIDQTIDSIKLIRKKSQPINSLTGGSTFKNPNGLKAWKLIDTAGCRGLSVGGAKISEIHANFIVNYNNATASDIENLGEEVRKRVYNKLGVRLEWEIFRVGKLL